MGADTVILHGVRAGDVDEHHVTGPDHGVDAASCQPGFPAALKSDRDGLRCSLSHVPSVSGDLERRADIVNEVHLGPEVDDLDAAAHEVFANGRHRLRALTDEDGLQRVGPLPHGYAIGVEDDGHN